MNEQANTTGKFTVVVTRVSTLDQSEEVQLELAKPYYENVSPERVKFVSEHGVSANKLSLRERPLMREFLAWIQQGLVESVIVYNRDRLARNYYEAMDMYPLFKVFNVKVIFTAHDTPPFGDYLQEAIAAIFAQMEGRNISRRTKDAHQTYPVNLKGYLREKHSVEGRQRVVYVPDGRWDETIRDMFNQCALVQSDDQFFDLLSRFAPRLKASAERLIRILETPFYAGIKQTKSSFVVLEHVTPIITTDLFEHVSKILKKYREMAEHVATPTEGIVVPICSLCGAKMKYRRPDIRRSGIYSCANGHPKNAIEIEELNKCVTDDVRKRLTTLNVDRLRDVCIKQVIREISKANALFQKCARELDDETIDLVLRRSPKKHDERNLQRLKVNLMDITSKQARLRSLMDEIDSLVHDVKMTVKGVLTEQHVESVVGHIVERVQVHPQYIELYVYFSEFFMEVDQGA